MITKIRVQGVQSHKDTRIELSDGVNLITGRSNSGKTALLRALILLFKNRPLGDKFKSHFAEIMEIDCSFDNGNTVSLVHGKNRIYRTGDDVYSGFKGQIPDVVEKAINLSDINIQRQFDQPYLVFSSPGEIAREINKILRLEKVDEWLRKLTTKINKKNTEKDIIEKQIEDKEKEIKNLAWVDKAERMLVRAEGFERELTRYDMTINAASNSIDEIDRLAYEIDKVKGWLKVDALVDEAFKLSHEIDNLGNWTFKVNEVLEIQEEISKLRESIPDAELIKQAENYYHQTLQYSLIESKSNRNIEEISTLERQITTTIDDLEKDIAEYISILKKAKKCPLCLSQITEKTIGRIVNEIR